MLLLWGTILLLHLHALDPGLEADEQLAKELARRLVGELAVRELGGRGADEHFRARQHVSPELTEDAAQVVLHACATHRPLRDGEDRDRLVLPGLVGRTRSPV